MQRKTSILLITIDSLRADHLGCYGYHRPTSPNIDRLASQGILFEGFFCAGIPTQPAYTTLYTGQHPIVHGIVAHGGNAQLSQESPFLPELLLAEGYTTCAFDNLAQLRAWFMRGYEYYINPGVRRPLLLGMTCDELNRRILPWLRTHSSEPFFVMIHYWDPHWPLDPPTRYRHLFYQGNPTDPANHSLDEYWKHPIGALARDTWLRRPEGPVTDREYVEALYNQEIRHVDDCVGELLATLDDLGLGEDTLVVVVADHGESMTEHGIYFDHRGLYDATIRVPLILRLPGRLPAGARVSCMFQQQDLAPTLLEAADAAIPEEMDGVSFWKQATGEMGEGGRRWIISVENTQQAKWSMRTENHKLILARKPDFQGSPPRELYDLFRDPVENQNLAEKEPGLTATMEADLEGWIAERLCALGKTRDPLLEEDISFNFA